MALSTSGFSGPQKSGFRAIGLFGLFKKSGFRAFGLSGFSKKSGLARFFGLPARPIPNPTDNDRLKSRSNGFPIIAVFWKGLRFRKVNLAKVLETEKNENGSSILTKSSFKTYDEMNHYLFGVLDFKQKRIEFIISFQKQNGN